jgi:serine/threonine-protein kinase
MAQQFGQDLILLERIAAGGMAEVYRAKQLGYAGFEKTVAVKRILPNFARAN